MAAPTNTTAATATELASLPVSITLDVTDAPASNAVWFKYTPPAGQTAIGVFGWADSGSTSYAPILRFYTGTPDALVDALPAVNITKSKHPATLPVVPGTTYYIRVTHTGTPNPAAAVLQLSVVAGPNESIPAGALLITDDTQGFPATILDPTDGRVLRQVYPFPHGEIGDVLPNGRFLVKADDRGKLALYNPDLTLRAIVSGVVGVHTDESGTYYDGTDDWAPQIRAWGEHTFYVLNMSSYDGSVTLYTVSDEGVVGDKVWTTIPNEEYSKGGIAVSPDGSILYYTRGSQVGGGPAIYRFDLVNEVPLTPLVENEGSSYKAGLQDLLCLSDGTILCAFTLAFAARPQDGQIVHYAADGTVLHTYPYHDETLLVGRLARDVTDATFWARIYQLSPAEKVISQFDRIRISDGTVLTSLEVTEFNEGYGPLASDADPVRFGPSNSCPLLVLRQPIGGEEPPPPTCEGVTATIVDPPDVNIISGTGTGLNATEWRVVRVSDGVVMDSGTGADAVFEFEGDYFVTYQLQFGNGAVWSASGCTFSFTFPEPIDTMADTTSPCVDYTTEVVNMALSRIGANKFITNLATDQTNEAKVARLHISADIDRTLRDFPWAFATGYATFTEPLAGTEETPVNADWQYSYRCPADFIFARRIVGQEDQRRRYDPNPIPFRLNLDDTWFLIYCDRPATVDEPLVLEYTRRPGCPASTPDALFRSCLAWRHAASLAPSLGRDEKVTAYCEQMYRYELPQAEAKSASEQQQEKPGEASWITGRE